MGVQRNEVNILDEDVEYHSLTFATIYSQYPIANESQNYVLVVS